MAYGDMMTAARKRRPATFGNSGSMQAAAQDQYNAEAGYGSDASAAYLERAQNFDPSAAVAQYAKGAWGSISDALKQQLTAQKGQEVGAGRFDSGFNDEDAGTVYGTATKQLSDAIAQQSIAASGQTLQNNSGLAQFATNQTEDANAMLSGEREFQYNQDAQDAANKKKKRSGIGGLIGGALGGVGGFFVGGPGGAIAGAKLGAKAGSAVGGY